MKQMVFHQRIKLKAQFKDQSNKPKTEERISEN